MSHIDNLDQCAQDTGASANDAQDAGASANDASAVDAQDTGASANDASAVDAQDAGASAVDANGAQDTGPTQDEPNMEDMFNDIFLSMHKFKQEFTTIQAKLKNLEKSYKKEKKKYEKIAGKQNKGNKAPGGFAKPTLISDELCEFMNCEKGTKVARTEVTQYISKYIEQNNLQNKNKRQYIIPDEALIKLWDVKNNNEEITYFNIQRLMNRHYI